MRLSYFMNRIIDVNQKYEKPIYQKLGVMNELAGIERYKQFKRNVILYKNRSEVSPNSRKVAIVIQFR